MREGRQTAVAVGSAHVGEVWEGHNVPGSLEGHGGQMLGEEGVKGSRVADAEQVGLYVEDG